MNAIVDVVIALDDTDLNLRGFGRFLQLLDRSYGRLLVGDLRRYVWDEDAQIRASQVRPGSWEVVLSQGIAAIPDPTPILVLYLLVKYLPKAVEHGATAVEKLATAYNAYEQGRLARANRQKLRTEISEDPELRRLPARQQGQLAEVIDVLIREKPSVSNPAQRFAARNLRRVSIHVRRNR